VCALYAALYSLGRAPIDSLRIDPAHHYFGQRLNVWVASGVCIVSFAVFFALVRRGTSRVPPWSPPAAPAAEPQTVAGHVPTPRPEAAIASRQRSQRRRRAH
jgi:hypothetical protein